MFNYRIKNNKYRRYHQEIQFYGSPSVGFGYEDAKFQGVSQATYSFKINDKMVDEILNEKIIREDIPEDEEDHIEKNLFLERVKDIFTGIIRVKLIYIILQLKVIIIIVLNHYLN